MKAKGKPLALLLLSGGIDSPVAGYLAKKKAEVIALHFSSEKITGKQSIEKSIKLCKILGIKRLFVCDISDQLVEIASRCKHAYYFVLMRRFMLRAAERIAKREHCDFILSGESIAQVSSQTLKNLAAISSAIQMPIARPLLCLEKEEIIKIAEKAGTFETSKGPEFCDALGPKHPITKASLARVLEEESKLDMERMLGDALKNIKEMS